MAGDIPKTRWARTIDGANIAHQDFGEGLLALVVIHGWLSHLDVYWEQPRFARFMRRLARNLRVIHFDKRGIGLSERLTAAPTLDAQMDDVRAVIEASDVDRVALLGWGTGGPALAAFYAATHPDKTIALCLEGEIHERREPDYHWGQTEEELERSETLLVSGWGDEDHALDLVREGMGERPQDAPFDDPDFLPWIAKLARAAATPSSLLVFDRMWFNTDERDVLPAVHVPTAVFMKTNWEETYREQARYMTENIPGARLVEVPGTAGVGWVEDPEPQVSAVEAFLNSAMEQEAELDRILAAVLFTDIVGSTEKAAKLGDHEWRSLLDRHHAAIRGLLARYLKTPV